MKNAATVTITKIHDNGKLEILATENGKIHDVFVPATMNVKVGDKIRMLDRRYTKVQEFYFWSRRTLEVNGVIVNA